MTEAAAPAIAVTTNEAPAQTTPAPTQETPANNTSPAESVTPAATPPTDAPPVDPAPTDTPVADAKDWFMRDKFATEVDQAKAYPELLKKMGENWGVPKDNYTLDGIEGIIKDDPLLTHLTPALKEIGLSQKGFANLIKSYQEANIKLGEAIAEKVQTELIAKDAQTVTAVDKWITDTFDEKQQSTIRSWIVSVEDFQLLNQLRVSMPKSTNVPSSNTNVGRSETLQEVENEKIKYRREVSEGIRVEDKNFANELQQRWKDAYQRDQHSKKK